MASLHRIGLCLVLNPAEPVSPPRQRIGCLVVLILVIGSGLASRGFESWLPRFVADHSGDALWTVAVYVLTALLLPQWSPLRLFAVALAASFVVEFSQLLDWQVLRSIRATRPGRLVLGSGFLWIDLVRYIGGGWCAVVIDAVVHRQRRGKL